MLLALADAQNRARVARERLQQGVLTAEEAERTARDLRRSADYVESAVNPQ